MDDQFELREGVDHVLGKDLIQARVGHAVLAIGFSGGDHIQVLTSDLHQFERVDEDSQPREKQY